MRKSRGRSMATGVAAVLGVLSQGALVQDAMGQVDKSFPDRELSRIAMGSCIRTEAPQHVWDAINEFKPDAWLWLGDNIYADIPRPQGANAEENAKIVLDRMPGLYEGQRQTPGYATLRQNAVVMGTWDDHDYGINDMGEEFVGKKASQKLFMDFFDEPADSARRTNEGVYGSWTFGSEGGGRVVQVIALDTRYFRSPLKRGENPRENWVEGYPGDYLPNTDAGATILGEAQWSWLEGVLSKPADVRIVISSIQVVSEDHRFEKWNNIPAERGKLFELIKKTNANGIIFVSGDRHSAELSLLDAARAEPGTAVDVGYPIYDLTASALTNSTPTTFEEQQASGRARPVAFFNEINRHRVGSLLRYNNFGTIEIDWDAEGGAEVILGLRTDRGDEVLRHRVKVAALKAGGQTLNQ